MMSMMKLIIFSLTNIVSIHAKTIERKGQRIVGGDPAPAGRFPFFAQYDPFACGATLIHNDIVLGAAHCCAPSECGLLFDSIDLGSGTPATVEDYIVHPQYDGSTSESDVMIMKLAAPLDITPAGYNVQSDVPADNDELTVIGFGTTSSGGSVSEELLQVTLDYVPNAECDNAYQPDATIFDDMLCAAAEGKDSCQGDSGGPIFTADDGTGDIVGVVSWGFGCADPDYPGVYARVSTYQEWIEEAICCMSDDPPDSCASNECSSEFGTVFTCGSADIPEQCEVSFLDTISFLLLSTVSVCLSLF